LFSVYQDLKEESEKSIEDTMECNWFKDPATREQEERERVKRQKGELEESKARILRASSKPEEQVVPEKMSDEDENVDLKKVS